MRGFFGGLLKIAGIAGIGYAIFIMVHWYILWISYYFVGNIKPSIVIGLITFFLAPLAGIADLFWHSFYKPTVEMWVYFIGFFVCGRIVFFIGDKVTGSR